jgi:histidyl-tRNA synthetase
MAITNPQIPKGTRDFLPQEVIRRNYIFDNIKYVFEKFGFFPIETPCFENLETLTGKYGEEGDRLLFKILNSGDFLAKADPEALKNLNSKTLTPSIAKKGLRYDLTVPFARFVVQHQNELVFPFKRYQIQQVWRADRPQKGRYQEFYQCDVDVIGSDSLMYEAELVQIYDQVFSRLGIDVHIVINNRKVLLGIAEACGIADQFMDMTIAIDKLDKLSEAKVIQEMQERDIPFDAANLVLKLLKTDTLDALAEAIGSSETGLKGVEEIRKVVSYLDHSALKNKLVFDPSLARGLNYYTGCIFEVKSTRTGLGSLGGGGRYDDLTAVFGKPDMSGVGISFGAERIYDLMVENALFPQDLDTGIRVLFIAFDETSHQHAFGLAGSLRDQSIKTDVYPEYGKMKKQLKFANAINVPYLAIVGEEEVTSGNLTVKDMQSGEQSKMTLSEFIHFLKSS